MKFILLVEENGYELRYWDEIGEEIGDSIISSWDVNEFYKKLVNMNFHISKKTISKAVSMIESGKNNFVVLHSMNNKPNHLDTLYEDIFELES